MKLTIFILLSFLLLSPSPPFPLFASISLLWNDWAIRHQKSSYFRFIFQSVLLEIGMIVTLLFKSSIFYSISLLLMNSSHSHLLLLLQSFLSSLQSLHSLSLFSSLSHHPSLHSSFHHSTLLREGDRWPESINSSLYLLLFSHSYTFHFYLLLLIRST